MELWLGQACGKDMKVWQLNEGRSHSHMPYLRIQARQWWPR